MTQFKTITGISVLFLLLCGCSQRPQEFKEWKCDGGRFKVLMPGTPKADQLTAAGIPLKTFTVEDWNGAYAAAYADIPEEILRYGAVSRMLDAGVDGMVSNVSGKLIRVYEVQLNNKYPGREVKAELPNGGIVMARIFLVKKRFYEVIVTGTKEKATSAEAKKFLESFALED